MFNSKLAQLKAWAIEQVIWAETHLQGKSKAEKKVAVVKKLDDLVKLPAYLEWADDLLFSWLIDKVCEKLNAMTEHNFANLTLTEKEELTIVEAIPDGIWANNIVDVMIEISENADIEEAAYTMERNGFIRVSAETTRISLNKGYTKDGFADKVYHIHLRYTGDNDELYFRDYLNENPHIAEEYESLKLELWKKYEHNRDAYTNEKTEFIRKWTTEARRIYGNRYRQQFIFKLLSLSVNSQIR